MRWLLVLMFGIAFAATAQENASTQPADPTEAAQMERLTQAQQLTSTGRHDEAIALLDQALAYYAQKYPEGSTRWYVARTPEEALLYMASAAASKQPAGKTDAQALSVLWAEAYYMKAYALFELDQLDAAKDVLGLALYLSPQNSRYLSELGQIYQTRQVWDEARKQYEAAESAAAFWPSEEELQDPHARQARHRLRTDRTRQARCGRGNVQTMPGTGSR